MNRDTEITELSLRRAYEEEETHGGNDPGLI
jgi:hypothetical protein